MEGWVLDPENQAFFSKSSQGLKIRTQRLFPVLFLHFFHIQTIWLKEMNSLWEGKGLTVACSLTKRYERYATVTGWGCIRILIFFLLLPFHSDTNLSIISSHFSSNSYLTPTKWERIGRRIRRWSWIIKEKTEGTNRRMRGKKILTDGYWLKG